MFARILGSTILAVALTHGAAFAQAQNTDSTGTVENNAQSSSPVLNEQSQPSGAAAKEQTEPSASSQQTANSEANAQNSSSTYSASGSSASNNEANNAPSDQVANNQAIPQQIRNKLQNMGFTDVQVVPGSFIVSAKDKDGDPVSMIIGPHSTTLFSVISPDNANNQQAQR